MKTERPEDTPLPVYARNGTFAFWAKPATIKTLLNSGSFKRVTRKNGKTVGLRAKLGDVAGAKLRSEAERIRSAGMGEAHRRETYFNPPRVWTIDRIPEHMRRMFYPITEGAA